jgi:predicted nucleic acid-binding protein
VTGPRVYADATALIGLARIDRLDLLDLLSVLATPIHVTAVVWDEAVGDIAKPGVPALERARLARLLVVLDEGEPEAFPQLDPGESTVLTAAAAAGAVVLLDERKARALITADPGLRGRIPLTIGCVGLLLLAKRRRRIPAVRPLLDVLRQQGFWIGAEVYADAVRQAREQ